LPKNCAIATPASFPDGKSKAYNISIIRIYSSSFNPAIVPSIYAAVLFIGT